jgi:AcrR family transcriptional regulator
MAGGNRQRILDASRELFNASGTVAVTTNHIARHLGISPGNLYFHFNCREHIVRELFSSLCTATYEAWDPKRALTPREFLESSFEVFWTYRFFHREMYHLRRQDPDLSQRWKVHMRKCNRLLKLNYGQWVSKGWMRRIPNEFEMQALSDSVLMSSSAYLAFFESPERPASRKSLRAGIEHVDRLLAPYMLQ